MESILDSVLDGSVHVGNKTQEESLTKLSGAAPDGTVNDQQRADTTELANQLDLQKKAVSDLIWKLNHEKSIHREMTELLEKKVADYLVQINTLQESESELKTKTESQETQIDQMQTKIKNLCNDLSNQTIENEKLQFKLIEISENVVGITKFEQL